jgi:hypothetical protein
MTRPLKVPTEPADIAALLHEAVVYGRTAEGFLVVGRRRPYIQPGTDPAVINRECARRYAVELIWDGTGSDTDFTRTRFDLTEIEADRVVPFLDVAAQLEAADAHANRVQRKGAGR